MSLKQKLVDYLTDNPSHLKTIYGEFSEEKPSTVRGRLNENIDKCFKRLSRGVYIASNGKSTALIIEGDAWEKIKDIETDSIDAIITDPPYTILNDFLATGTTRKKRNEWSFKTKDIDLELLQEFNRVLKDGGHFFCFLPANSKKTYEFNDRFIRMAMTSGFEFNKSFVWDKQAMGCGYNGRAKYEQIIFFSKGKRHMPYDKSIPDLLNHKRIYHGNRIHETEKPVELIEDLVKFCSEENDVILDTFAGSLSTARACLRQNRNSISIESARQNITVAIDHMKDDVHSIMFLEE